MNDAVTATERDAEAPARDPYGRFSWIVVVVGLGLYAANFLSGKALWHDEAMVALNLRHLTWAELAGRLDYDQLAPIGWLYLQKGLYQLTGDLEFGLRLSSLAAAAGALVLFRNLAFRVLGGFGAFSALALFVLMVPAIRYAAEAKPYTVDLFLVVAVMITSVRLISRDPPRWWNFAFFALVGFAAIVFSLAAAYLLAAAAVAVFLTLALHRSRQSAGVVVGVSAAWFAAFLILMLGVYAPQLTGSELVEGRAHQFFSRTSFAPFPPTSLADLTWYVDWGARFVTFLFGKLAIAPLMVLFFIGVFVLIPRSLPLALIAWGPLLIALIASSFEVYPLYERLVLFLAPGLLLAAGAGASWLAVRGPRGFAVAAVLVMAVSLSAAVLMGRELGKRPPFANQDIRPALVALAAEARPGDRVHVGSEGTPAYLLYRRAFGLGATPWTSGGLGGRGWPCLLSGADGVPRDGRLWLLVVQRAGDRAPEPSTAQGALAARGLSDDLALKAQGVGAQLYLAAPRAAPAVATPAATACPEAAADPAVEAPRILAREGSAKR
jgi:hypothetical protein